MDNTLLQRVAYCKEVLTRVPAEYQFPAILFGFDGDECLMTTNLNEEYIDGAIAKLIDWAETKVGIDRVKEFVNMLEKITEEKAKE